MKTFSWEPRGIEEPGRFANLTPVDILDWFDGPRLFTISENDVLYLTYACSESSDAIRYLVVPTDDRRIQGLNAGSVTLLEALRTPVLWVVDVRGHNAPSVRRVAWSSVPTTVIPQPKVLLSRNLEPLFQIDVQGDGLFPAVMTAGLLRRYVDSSYSILNRFFQSINWQGGYDPPIQRMAIGSLHLAFSSPGNRPSVSTAKELAADFQARAGDHGDPTIVAEIVKLCPFQQRGLVDTVQLTGQLMKGAPITLRRGDRPQWRDRLKRLQEGRTSREVALEGRVEEIDWGRSTFTLRGIEGEKREQACRADEFTIDELRELYNIDNPETRIRVFGTATDGESHVEVNRFEVLDAAGA